ncbi:MAG: lipoprotein [Porticoccaceae bacterium]
MHRRKLIVIGAALSAVLLIGCGNKGPLYLPEAPAEPQSAPPPSNPPPPTPRNDPQ